MASRALAPSTAELKLTQIASFERMRCLAWSGDVLYASRGYELFRISVRDREQGQRVGDYHAPSTRRFSSRFHLGSRLMRDGFHALAVLLSGDLIAAVPGAILRLAPGESEFKVTHQVQRGSRPLHFAAAPNGNVFWGEYFDNRKREEVYIYGSSDRGESWDVAYVFARRGIRHVHNIVYDRWDDRFWVLTGDEGRECRIMRASTDFKDVDVVLCSGQQTRAAALTISKEAVFFSSDSPHEPNHIYRLDRRGNLASVAEISSSSIYACRAGSGIFFSTMAEPSIVNVQNEVNVYGSFDGWQWTEQLHWHKDPWPMRYFQYGNAFLPDGENESDLLAVSTLGVNGAQGELSLWRVQSS